MTNTTAEEVVAYWFSDAVKPLWFKSTREFDLEIKQRFLSVHELAATGCLSHWKSTPVGALALIILLDQIPLNIFRGEAASYQTEYLARELANFAIEAGFEQAYTPEQKVFLYMPFMHSENLDDQNRSVELFKRAGLQANLRYAEHHRNVIRRFGRFPHRNAILLRRNTPEELDYLQSKHAFLG